MNSRRRKAAVAEADCLECIKLLLEKTVENQLIVGCLQWQCMQNSWAYILDYSGNLEVLLFSLNSPQLDSKCYSLEVNFLSIATIISRLSRRFLP